MCLSAFLYRSLTRRGLTDFVRFSFFCQNVCPVLALRKWSKPVKLTGFWLFLKSTVFGVEPYVKIFTQVLVWFLGGVEPDYFIVFCQQRIIYPVIAWDIFVDKNVKSGWHTNWNMTLFNVKNEHWDTRNFATCLLDDKILNTKVD